MRSVSHSQILILIQKWDKERVRRAVISLGPPESNLIAKFLGLFALKQTSE